WQGRFANTLPQACVILTRALREAPLRTLHPDDFHQLLDGSGGFFECGLLFRCQLDLNDLFNSARAELNRNAHEQPMDSVLTFQIRGAGQDFLAVVEYRVN